MAFIYFSYPIYLARPFRNRYFLTCCVGKWDDLAIPNPNLKVMLKKWINHFTSGAIPYKNRDLCTNMRVTRLFFVALLSVNFRWRKMLVLEVQESQAWSLWVFTKWTDTRVPLPSHSHCHPTRGNLCSDFSHWFILPVFDLYVHGNHIACSLLCLASFSRHCVREIHPSECV